MDNIKNFFYPSSVCLLGASSKEKSIGYELLKTILLYGYKGRLYPVNPGFGEIFGQKCYASVDELPSNIDLAIIALPKSICYDAIKTLIQKNTRSIILITAGFKETGRTGAELENRITELVKNSGARMTGPNCMGVINTDENVRLNATFVAESPHRGRTGFLSQSGALGAAVLNSLRETGIRFSHFISVGNKADITENDIIEFWQNDNNTDVMALYLESFSDGRGLIDKIISGIIKKPLLILKAGRTRSGMKAASSHTGAMAGSDMAADTVMNQFGMIRAAGINELFNTAKGLEHFNIPAGNRVAIVTNAGGPAILATDACEKEGLKIAKLSDSTKTLLRSIVNAEGSVENPVDLLPLGTSDAYKKTCTLLLDDENVDSVISIFVEPVMVETAGVVNSLNSIVHSKPLLQVIMPLPSFWDYYRENFPDGKPLFRNPEDPAKILSNMLFYEAGRKQNEQFPRLASEERNIKYSGRGYLDNESIKCLSEKYNIPVVKNVSYAPETLLSEDFELSEELQFPLVLKAINKDIIHKSDSGAVITDIKNIQELRQNAFNIAQKFFSMNLAVTSFMLQPYLKAKHELLIGGYNDASFGPMIMFGTGGKYVEVYKDIRMKSAYLNEADLNDIIFNTGIGKILAGVRGEKPAEISHLKELIKNTALMMIENPGILEFDLNPVIMTENGMLSAVDIRIKT